MNTRRLFIAVLLTIFLSSCNFTLAADVTPPPGYQPPLEMPVEPSITTGPMFPIVAPDPGKGEVIYQEKCAPCHGNTGLGDGEQGSQLPNPVPAIGTSQLARQAQPAQWYGIVTKGNLERFMPPFSSLSDRQRWDVIAYVLSLSSPPEIIARGAELYQSNCANCHGERGKGDGPEGGADLPDFTNQERMAGRSAEDMYSSIADGIPSTMPAFAEKLSEEEIWALTSLIRSFSFKPDTGIAQQLIETTPAATVSSEDQPVSESVPTGEITQAGEFGSITGKVINGTDGKLTAGIKVNLHGFDHTSIAITDTVPINEDGTYVFDNIEMVDGRIFLTSTDFAGVTYASEAVAAENGQKTIDLPIQVFEATTDASTLKVDRLHYFFEPVNEQLIRVVELFVISNPSGKTLVASSKGQPVLNFKLPQDATNLQIQDGELGQRFIQTEQGFGDTVPIRPGDGTYQLLYSYEIPFKKTIEFIRSIDLPVNAVVILVPENGISIKGDAIQDGGIREVQGVAYHLYNGNSILPGNELKLTINNSHSFFSTGSNTNLVIGVAALGVVLVVSGIWLFQRNRSLTKENSLKDDVEPSIPAYENREAVMDAILALDDLFQEGKLPQEAYIQRRMELKNRLRELNERPK